MLPREIEQFFLKNNIQFEIVTINPNLSVCNSVIEVGINPGQVAVASLLRDKKGSLLTIYPANSTLDIHNLNEKLRRQFQLLPLAEIQLEWPTYGHGECIPLAQIYRLDAEVFDDFISAKSVYFQINKGELCRVSSTDFCKMQGSAMYDDFFVKKPANPDRDNKRTEFCASRKDAIRDRLKSINALPAMPTIAQRLLRLNMKQNPTVKELSDIVEQDPSLCAQLIRFSRSSLYQYRGELRSIKDVIARVLGFNLVLDMALGVAIGKAFKNPREGKLGLTEYWRHAIYSAVLCEKLCQAVGSEIKPDPATAYLCGLLHNFGFLVLGHLFPQEFTMLNQAATKYPDSSIIDLEHTIVGVTHMEMGAWLMQAWNLPEEVVVVVREHHNEHYHDTHSVYANLAVIANRMLVDLDLGDEKSNEFPTSIVNALELDTALARNIHENIIESSQGLDSIATQLAA